MFLLLMANTVVFAVDGTAAEGLDAAAWLTLLLLFELETAHARRLSTRRALVAVHTVRLVAGAAVLAAAIGYVNEEDWLDSANACLWIAVVVLLEFKLRFEQGLARHLGVVETIAAVLYLGLAALVLVWAWRGEWFDAYDAALWLVAFATIEMNVLAIRR
ncbi:MAG: hypothetical protein ACREUZ_09770 [Burkholderiales bacterium]